jgi:fibronectin type 3 domain-containing protein
MTYYFVVRAYSDAGESENSNETIYTVPSYGDTTPPLAPQGIEARVSGVSITLDWQENAEPDFSEYKVYYGNSSRNYGPSIPAGKATSYTIQNLEGGKTYYLAVSALDAAGNESGYSGEAVETIPSDPDGTDPGAGPMLQWDAVTGEVTGYMIYYGTISGAYSDSIDAGNVTQYLLTDLPLAEGTTYYFAIKAYNNSGESDPSEEVSYSTSVPEDTTPPLELGHSDYCKEYGPCEAGEGDCDTGQCQSGLVCAQNVGAKYGFEATVDVCESPEPSDITAPTVAITAPTGGSTYTASSAPVELSGTASDNIGVDQVSWINDRGGSGTASGTTSWSASGIQLSEGDNVLTVTATDASGNQSTDTLTVLYTSLDTVDPAVTITSPTSGSAYTASNSSIDLSGSASDNVGIRDVLWSNDRGGSDVASGTTSWSIADVDLAEGANQITITATDTSGNQSTDTLTVTYTAADTINPLISITSPTSESTYETKNSSLNLSGSASDNNHVSQVAWANSRGGSGMANGTAPWSISNIQLSEGDNLLTVTAKDAAGNQSTDKLSVVYNPLDTTAPIVTIKSPTTRSKYMTKNSSVTLSGSASDNIGVTLVTWINSRGGRGTANGTAAWSISNISLSEGENVLTVTARDAIGNQFTDKLTVVMKSGGKPRK